MKATLFALVALVAGIAGGIAITRQEFANEAVPVDLVSARGVGAGSKPAVKIGPKVSVINGERHDFGSMERNAHGTHKYVIKNIGDAPLTLQTGSPSCSVCIKVFEVEKETLQPGERTHVKIEWDVKTGDAEFEQSGPLETNDPKRATVHLSVHGNIIETVRVDRPDLHFHDLSASEPASGSVIIYAYRDPNLEVEEYNTSNPTLNKYLNVTFTPLSPLELSHDPRAKGGLKMNVEIKPGLPLGDFNEPIHISVNQSEDPLTVRVIGNVASDVLLIGAGVSREKSLVNLGTVASGEGKKQTIYLLVKGPHRNETKVAVKCDEPESQFRATLGEELHDTAKTIRYPIVLEIPPGATPVSRLDAAKVHITTTHPDVKEMTIKVRYVVKE
jgi:hypothetical protein